MESNSRKRKDKGVDDNSATIKRNKRESAVVRLGVNCTSIANIVEKEFSDRGLKIRFSERAIGRVSQIISQTVEKQYIKDLYTYASHGKRVTPNVNDAKLLYHRNPEIKKRVENLVKTFDNNVTENSGTITVDEIPSIKKVIEKRELAEKAREKALDLQPEMKILRDNLISEFSNKPIVFKEKDEVTLINDPFYEDVWDQLPTTSKNNGVDVNSDVQIIETSSEKSKIKKETTQVQSTTKVVKPVDSFYDDDFDWANVVNDHPIIPVNKENNIIINDSFYNDEDLDWIPRVPAVQTTPAIKKDSPAIKKDSPAIKKDSPIAKTTPIVSTVQTTPKLLEENNWFQPDSHSTPINATFRKNETLNLSIDAVTPQRAVLKKFVTPRPIMQHKGLRRPPNK